MAKTWFDQFELEKDGIRLIPLKKDHKSGLIEAAADGELWNLWVSTVPSSATIDDYIDKALDEKENRGALPLVVIDMENDRIIGSTRYMNVDIDNRRLEIGSTWYSKSYQRTRTNTICKLLLLQYAFEKWNAIAVEFRTHWFNHASRKAIERLGAKQDGVLRNHRISPDGTLRDTVVYSILQSEWPTVKKSLLFELKKHKDRQ